MYFNDQSAGLIGCIISRFHGNCAALGMAYVVVL